MLKFVSSLVLFGGLVAGCSAPAAVPTSQVLGESSVLVLGSVREVAQRSDAVIIGTAVATAGTTTNVGGDGKNPTFVATYQLFTVNVDQVLKGTPPKQIKVALVSTFGPTGQPAAQDEGYLALTTGRKYALFLRQVGDGLFAVAPQPNRFVIGATEAQPETRWAEISRRFPAVPVAVFLDQLRAAVAP